MRRRKWRPETPGMTRSLRSRPVLWSSYSTRSPSEPPVRGGGAGYSLVRKDGGRSRAAFESISLGPNSRADRLCYGGRAPPKKTMPMNDRFLKTGIFLAPFHPLLENPLLALDRDMELLVHLDKLNYHEAWIGEHHSGGYEIIACPEMFIAAAAERTRHIRLGTGVVSLPYHNPFTVAGRLMQLDYMTRGRAMFGVGPGSLVYDAVKMGLKPEDQRRKLDESLAVIMELMQGRMVTRKTDWFDLQEARLQLKSYSQPMMEMAVASSRSPTGALAAGKHGIGMLSIGGTSDEALKGHAGNWGVSEERARASGKTPDRRNWRIVTFAHVAETSEQARQDVKFGLEDFK